VVDTFGKLTGRAIAVSVACTTMWNSLPRHVHDPVHPTSDIFLFRVLVYTAH